MPLPPALLARLAKRGIVEASEPDKSATKSGEEVEEVFAEDYDDPSKPEVQEEVAEPIPQDVQPLQVPEETSTEVETIHRETTACPTRSNPYHICVPYCRRNYGMSEWNPDSKMLKRRDRMLRKYPLPEGWIEVADHDSSRFYYWNPITDQVSWLSPTHPKAHISQSAENLGLVGKIGNLDSDGEQEMDADAGEEEDEEEDMSEKSGSDTSLSDEEDQDERKSSKIESRLFRTPPDQQKSKQPESRKGRGKKEELDPMDPASYSDIARGGWSDGLDTRGKAKTGVDETASGPLFQQRPYPSPGDILRANQSNKKKK